MSTDPTGTDCTNILMVKTLRRQTRDPPRLDFVSLNFGPQGQSFALDKLCTFDKAQKSTHENLDADILYEGQLIFRFEKLISKYLFGLKKQGF